MSCGSPDEDPCSEKKHCYASTALHGSSGLKLYMGHTAVAKLDFGLQRSCVLAKVTGMFEQAHSLVALAAPCPPLQDTEDSVGPSGRHISQGCMKRCTSPGLCKRTLTHLKQTCTPQDCTELGFTEPSSSFQVLPW